jgi:lipid II:glycine glycyltransferase (peptidoglycan interpeptide bridge formation enzyme)
LDDSLEYLLQWNNFYQKELYISHAVDIYSATELLNLLKKRKRRYLNNNNELKTLKFKESNEFDEFYKILLASKEKFQTKPTHSLEELNRLKAMFPNDIKLLLTIKNDKIVGGSLIFFANGSVSLVFYNTILNELKKSQIAMLQLYKCMEISKQYGYKFVDFGVSHTPEAKDPMAPKLSLIHFKEQFNARGVLRVAYQKDFNDS